jgi:hypothetical protein
LRRWLHEHQARRRLHVLFRHVARSGASSRLHGLHGVCVCGGVRCAESGPGQAQAWCPACCIGWDARLHPNACPHAGYSCGVIYVCCCSTTHLPMLLLIFNTNTPDCWAFCRAHTLGTDPQQPPATPPSVFSYGRESWAEEECRGAAMRAAMHAPCNMHVPQHRTHFVLPTRPAAIRASRCDYAQPGEGARVGDAAVNTDLERGNLAVRGG